MDITWYCHNENVPITVLELWFIRQIIWFGCLQHHSVQLWFCIFFFYFECPKVFIVVLQNTKIFRKVLVYGPSTKTELLWSKPSTESLCHMQLNLATQYEYFSVSQTPGKTSSGNCHFMFIHKTELWRELNNIQQLRISLCALLMAWMIYQRIFVLYWSCFIIVIKYVLIKYLSINICASFQQKWDCYVY